MGSKGTWVGFPHSAQTASAGSTAGLTRLTAGLAAGGLVLESLFGIEFLFTSSENELSATVFAHQRFVFVHGLVTPIKIDRRFLRLTWSLTPHTPPGSLLCAVRALTRFSPGSLSRTDLHLDRTMLPAALGGLRGPLCLRLASVFNHRPEGFNRRHYIAPMSKTQGFFPFLTKRTNNVHQILEIYGFPYFFCP